jgi:hypothetical protein
MCFFVVFGNAPLYPVEWRMQHFLDFAAASSLQGGVL